jgi:hypothetical protein
MLTHHQRLIVRSQIYRYIPATGQVSVIKSTPPSDGSTYVFGA